MLKSAKFFIKLWAILINRDTFWSLHDLNYWEFKRGSWNLLDVRTKSIFVFKICKLTSLTHFELPNRSVLVTAASALFKRLLSILVILLRKVFVSVRKLWQWRRKWHVFLTSQPQLQSGFSVSWKLFLNLCSWRWLSPSRYLDRYLIPFRFWQLNVLFAVGLINFKTFFLKILRLGGFELQSPIYFIHWWPTKGIFE